MNLKERIKKHEGLRFTPYEDSLGILTVGYGRNLRDVPFSQEEVDFMFERDFERAEKAAALLPVYRELNAVRQGVLIEMIFQMGLYGVSKFKKFLAAALVGDWHEAKKQMLDSQWAKQTPERAEELAEIFHNG